MLVRKALFYFSSSPIGVVRFIRGKDLLRSWRRTDVGSVVWTGHVPVLTMLAC